MAKVNIQLCSYRCQSPVDSIKKQFSSDIPLWSDPFPFYNTSQSLNNIQMKRIRGNIEEKATSFFPYGTHSLYFLITAYTCIVKQKLSAKLIWLYTHSVSSARWLAHSFLVQTVMMALQTYI